MTRKPPGTPVEIPALNHRGHEYTSEIVLIGICDDCGSRCYAMENKGVMCCPHCRGPVQWQPARARLQFVPESDPQYMGWVRGKNPAREREKKKP